MEFTLNETGHDLLNTERELEQKAKGIEQAYDNGNTTQFQSFMGTNTSWVPFQLFSGLLDVLFFASAMSFLGLAMSPQGSSMVGDTGRETESASDSDTTAGKEDSSTDNSSSG